MVCSVVHPQRRPVIAAPLGTITVAYGAHDLELDLAGYTVEEVQASLRDFLNIGMEAEGYVDGRPALPTYRLQQSNRLEFVKERGSKGVGSTWTKTEFTKLFRMGEADWTDWVARGLPFDTMKDGTVVLNETEVDQWKQAQREQKPYPASRAAARKQMLSLKDAAAYLGMTVSGLRKLVDKNEIHYFQRKAHSPIMFKAEWLDEYVSGHTHGLKHQPTRTTPPRRQRRTPVNEVPSNDARHGFHWDWMKP
jgi:hypothetical protein